MRTHLNLYVSSNLNQTIESIVQIICLECLYS